MKNNRQLDNDAPGMDGAPIDLNALAAPENSSQEIINSFESKDESQPTFEKGPTDLDKQIDAELGNVKSPQSSQGSDTFNQSNNNSSDQFYIQPFKELQKRLGLTDEEFQLPQDINQENYFDKLTEAIYANTEFENQQESNLHPDIARLNELVSNGIPFEQAIQEYNHIDNLASLQDKELVKLSLMHKFGAGEDNPNGWSQEKIEATLAKMENAGYLEMEAEKVRGELYTERETVSERMLQEQHYYQQQESIQMNAAREQGIKDALSYLQNQNDIYGLPISKAEISEFADDFKYLVTPDETGTAPGIRMLQSNENLAKVMYMLKKADSKVRETLDRAKAGAKQSIIDKLDNQPEVPRRTQGQDTSNVVDLDLLSMPARY